MTLINTADPNVAKRLIQRDDDTEDKIRNRLRLYHLNVEEIRLCYSSICRRVDGNRSKEEIFSEIQAFVDGTED